MDHQPYNNGQVDNSNSLQRFWLHYHQCTCQLRNLLLLMLMNSPHTFNLIDIRLGM